MFAGTRRVLTGLLVVHEVAGRNNRGNLLDVLQLAVGQLVVAGKPLAVLNQEEANTLGRGLIKISAGDMEGVGASDVNRALREVQGGADNHG